MKSLRFIRSVECLVCTEEDIKHKNRFKKRKLFDKEVLEMKHTTLVYFLQNDLKCGLL